MWIDKIFGGNKLQNAGTAKERLQFIIARERSGAASFDMQKMQQEVIDVIKRYIADLRDDQVNITQEIQDRYEVVSVNITLPEIIEVPMEYLAALNTPVPMIIIGCQLAGVNFAKAFGDKRSYLSIGSRLLVIPALSLFLMYLCGMRGSMLVASVIATSAPSAATTTMFATKFDRDVTLSVSLVSTTTLFSIITMPLMVALSQYFA